MNEYPLRIWETSSREKISIKLTRIKYLLFADALRNIDLFMLDRYERVLYGYILVNLLSRIMAKLPTLKPDKNTLSLSKPEGIALIKALSGYTAPDKLQQFIINEIITTIDRKI